MKGGPGSGNWGHTSFGRDADDARGGSDPKNTSGGGLGALGLDASSTIEERRQASAQLRRTRIQEGAGKREEAALAPFNIREQDLETYREAMALQSDDAKAMLDRFGLTREQVWKMMDDGRKKQQGIGDSRAEYMAKGGYPPERQKVHDDLVAAALEGKPSVPEGEQPTIIFTGGFPGAGKSSMMQNPEYKDRIGDYVHVDSDGFKAGLAKADGIDKVTWQAQYYHQETYDVISRVFQGATEARNNIVFDGTMNSTKKVMQIAQEFKDRGYRIEIAFADLPMRKSMERALGRFAGEGGRLVDPAYIASNDGRNIATLNQMKGMADSWRHWNTDVPYGQLAELVGEG